MIAELFEAVGAALKKVRNCAVYRENIPQGFEMPSFLVEIYDQNPTRGINTRLKNTVGMAVTYFPENESGSEAWEECWDVGEDLNLGFKPEGFKIHARSLSISDSTLLFTFRVDYRELLPDSAETMQEMTQNTDLKGV